MVGQGGGPVRRLVESAALVAALATPLFFAPYTEHVFEPAKAALVRFLGILALGAGALLFSRRPRPAVGARAIAWAIVAVWAAEALATLFSRVPALSLMGAPDRAQGLVTLTAVTTLGLAAIALAQRPNGAWRLAAWLAAAAAPVSIYAVAQYGRWAVDPLPWAGDTMTRVAGPAGNSVMLAAHLAVVTPLAVALTALAWRRVESAGAGALAVWCLATASAVAAIVASGSRGPALALAGGLFTGGLLLAAHLRNRRAAIGLAAIAATGIGLVIGLNAATDSFSAFERVPFVGRLSQALDPERSTTRVRLRLWEGSAEAIAAAGPRLLVGSGPESMSAIWAPYYPSILAYDEPRGFVPDRAHNLVLDDLITVGLLGLVAHLLLFTAVLETGLKRLALLSGGRWTSTWVWRTAWLGGGAAGTAAAWVAGGPHMAGLGLGVGLAAGLVGWLVVAAFAAEPAMSPNSADGPKMRAEAILVAGLLAATMTHLLELQVSFPTVATRLAFVLVAAAVAGLTARAGREMKNAPRRPRLATDPALAAFVVAATMAHAFARPGLVAGGAPAALLLTIAAGAAAALAVWAAGRAVDRAADRAPNESESVKADHATRSAAAGTWTAVYLVGVALLAAMAATVPILGESVHKEARLVWLARAQEVRAEAEGGKAEAFFAEAADRFARAAQLAPWSPEPLLSLGRLETERADNLDEQLTRLVIASGESPELADEYAANLPPGAAELVSARDEAFGRAVVALGRADRLWAPAPEPALTLARALRVWAERTRSASERAARLASAADAYEAALRRAPHWPEVYDEAAWAALLAEAPAHALTLTDRALSVDGFFLRAHRTAAAAYAELGDDDASAVAYRAYFADDRNSGDLPALRGLLAALLRLGKSDEALPVGESVALLAPNDAHALADLAVLREAVGDLEGALVAARSAAELAPADNGITGLVRGLEQRLRQER